MALRASAIARLFFEETPEMTKLLKDGLLDLAEFPSLTSVIAGST